MSDEQKEQHKQALDVVEDVLEGIVEVCLWGASIWYAYKILNPGIKPRRRPK